MSFSSYLPEPVDPEAFAAAPKRLPPGPVGLLFINLGTPDAPDTASIRRYLGEFLSDPRVVELPPWLWQLILRGAVLPFRPRKLAPRYAEIWMPGGSPLLVWSQAQVQAVQAALHAQGKPAVRAVLAMRYGRPSIEQAMQALRAHGCERILVVPMYPQYAASTTATAVDAVAKVAARLRNQPEMRFIKRFHHEPEYIAALAAQLERHWAEQGRGERVLLSFHGLPNDVVQAGDPYHRDCMETAQLLRKRLGVSSEVLQVSFQSRFGRQKWLEPYTEPTLAAWGAQGIRSVDVLCPGFLADCLETLEEIQMQCKDAFIKAGGQSFRYVPCLNDDPLWAQGFAAIVGRHIQGWG
ncbi:ferrochelatase [Pusillimonas sp. CC-YST705]|uniref:Ferrochelatase n=1 Tax=Mesopusillimonas faecipullorum TaxID=2755040 RepID=A0ABS8C8F7_9BURK|nr:ferrochelatase [Mesopusillimonas faecipullorum]MCB5362316.1 ferrochelatase [Mesopusillimonas faecipullorum]